MPNLNLGRPGAVLPKCLASWQILRMQIRTLKWQFQEGRDER